MELFFRLNELFESDTEIDELGLLVAFPQKIGASQASADNSVALHEPFLLQEHKLGVSFWAIPPLFEFALGLFRQEQLLVDSGAPLDRPLAVSILASTRCMLLVSADRYTAWNYRKRCILAGFQSPIAELQFVTLIFSKHPKAGESWAHRRWVLKQLLPPAFSAPHVPHTTHVQLDADALADTLATEISVCTRVADIYPKNYFAWAHRQWLVQSVLDEFAPVDFNAARLVALLTPEHVKNHASEHVQAGHTMRGALLTAELKLLEKWSNRHVSDHSGFHQRQIALVALCAACPTHRPHDRISSHSSTCWTSTRFLSQSLTPAQLVAVVDCTSCAAIESEMVYVTNLMATYPGHESLWYHRRFLVLQRIELLSQHHPPSSAVTICYSDRRLAFLTALQRLFTAEHEHMMTHVTDIHLERFEVNRRFALACWLWILDALRAACLDVLAQEARHTQDAREARERDAVANEPCAPTPPCESSRSRETIDLDWASMSPLDPLLRLYRGLCHHRTRALRAIAPFWPLQAHCWSDAVLQERMYSSE